MSLTIRESLQKDNQVSISSVTQFIISQVLFMCPSDICSFTDTSLSRLSMDDDP